uniref:Uncharacterized protein n=1 Tax=Physcomitrium patens TaxID=3218 RepID=A0A2K1IG95_PHYPA|nr:hypothetical protein PHYPA_028895 [Physcomitrium patens]
MYRAGGNLHEDWAICGIKFWKNMVLQFQGFGHIFKFFPQQEGTRSMSEAHGCKVVSQLEYATTLPSEHTAAALRIKIP